MKKLFLFLLPVFSFAQISITSNDSIGEHIGLHIIYYLGRVNGGVSLGKLPNIDGKEFHQLIWTNSDYDKVEERTLFTFHSTSSIYNYMFEFDQYLGFISFLTILTIGFWLMIFLLTFVIPYWLIGALKEYFKYGRNKVTVVDKQKK